MDASVGDPPFPILIKVDAGSKQAENSLSSRSSGPAARWRDRGQAALCAVNMTSATAITGIV